MQNFFFLNFETEVIKILINAVYGFNIEIYTDFLHFFVQINKMNFSIYENHVQICFFFKYFFHIQISKIFSMCHSYDLLHLLPL